MSGELPAGPAVYPPLVRRTPREALQWLANQLVKGADPHAVALALWLIAGELDAATWPEKVAAPPPPV